MTSNHRDDAYSNSGSYPPHQSSYGTSPTGAFSRLGQGEHQPPQGPKRSQNLVIVLAVVISIVALLLVGLVAALLLSSSNDKAEAVFSSCSEQVPGANSATLSADEKSIKYDWGANPDSSDIAMLSCLLAETGAPSAVEARMESTRALDGTQDAEWENWSAFWNYHPDSGLDATFTME